MSLFKSVFPWLAQVGGQTTARDVDLRPLVNDDAAELQRSCWPAVELVDVYTLVSDISRRQRAGLAWGLVARVDGQIVGFGQLTRWGSVWEIGDLIVNDKWRGQGIGTALIKTLLKIAGQQGYRDVEIGVALSNPRALKLYRKLGFKPRRTVHLNLGQGEEPVVYLGMVTKKRKVMAVS
jgi:ribosomal protein S18 acetylase RimI-like enzyme